MKKRNELNWKPFHTMRKGMMWAVVLTGLLFCAAAQGVHAQTGGNFVVTGAVVDGSGEPLAGVNVVQKNAPGNGTVTNADGKYFLSVTRSGVTLTFSYIGFVSQDAAVSGNVLNVTMKEDLQALDEVVVVGYGTQRKSTLTGSVSAIKAEQITVAPVGNVTNALTGKLPGLITVQSSGMPGSDNASVNIRGFGSPLVIVDGVEALLTNIDPSQIETISILKDGAASIYGARAGNGVLLVTTKRGVTSKPTITLNTSYTMQGVTSMARTASSGQLAQLQREAHLNAGQPEESAPFTAEDVEKYFAGNDPAYPSSDWYDFVFRDWAPQQNHNVSIRGGNEKLKYLGFFGYQNQGTMVKKNAGNYSRYNVQSNIDAKITSRLSLSVDIFAAYEDSKFARRVPSGYYWQDLYSTRPWYPTTLPDPTKLAAGGIDMGSVAITSNMDIDGYNHKKVRDLHGRISLSYDVPYIEGLTAKAFVNYEDWQTYTKDFMRPFQWYTYNNEADVYTLAGTYRSAAEASERIDFRRQLTQQYSLNYDHTFNNTHHVTALAMIESLDYADNYFTAARREFLTPAIEQLFAGSAGTQTNNGSANEAGRASVIGRVNYDYMERYLLEAILRADASAKFPEDKRWGYFPGVSLGWVISREGFMRNLNAVEFLKLRASYGSSGNDNVGDFKYLTGFNISGLYQWGDRFVSGLNSTGMANPLLTWEKMSVYNGGVDFSALNRTIYGTVEAFYRTREGIPATRSTSLPSTFGATLPTENINSLNDRGFELSLGTAKNNNEFMYDISANISWSRTKWDHYEEPEYDDPDQKRINGHSGQWVDRVMGYVSDGLFTSQAEIDALPYDYAELGGGKASLRPGDVKYKDMNGDGVLDWKDQREVGSGILDNNYRDAVGKGTMPHWFYGLNGAFSWRNFDLTVMFQGAFGYHTAIGGYFTTTDTYYKLRWTETNNHRDVLIARPGGAASNSWRSDYNLRSAAYLRLKNASLGYSLPKPWSDKIGIERLRLYVASTNLFTLSTLSEYYIDPEAPSNNIGNYYPQQRTISFGLNLNF
ncbi:MAG: TonB-dependent receptor [Tannerella sp.]|jgi:TonB-linked SusC/RagA family outer membrane protein|nr:TonB-dependent receptor [Tannerella sp.]